MKTKKYSIGLVGRCYTHNINPKDKDRFYSKLEFLMLKYKVQKIDMALVPNFGVDLKAHFKQF
jgi:hypothetical protein